MAGPSKKRSLSASKTADDDEHYQAKREASSDDEQVKEEETETQRSKKSKGNNNGVSGKMSRHWERNKEGDQYLQLSGKRRLTIRQFKGATLIDIREYYTDKLDGEDKPGKKGISLDVDQWTTLKSKMDEIDEAIEALEKKKK